MEHALATIQATGTVEPAGRNEHEPSSSPRVDTLGTEPPRAASAIASGSQLIPRVISNVGAHADFWEALLGNVQSVTAILDKFAQVIHSRIILSVLSAYDDTDPPLR